MWMLINMQLNNQWVTNEIKGEILKYLETNENTMIQNVWDAANAVLTGKLIVIQAYLRNKTKLNLTLQLMELEKRTNKLDITRSKEK